MCLCCVRYILFRHRAAGLAMESDSPVGLAGTVYYCLCLQEVTGHREISLPLKEVDYHIKLYHLILFYILSYILT